MPLINSKEITQFLKNKLTLFASCFAIISCVCTPLVKIKSKGLRTEFRLKPDRLAMECEPIDKNRYGFSVFILNQDKTVTTLIQTNVLDLESCRLRMNRLKTMSERNQEIYLAGMGDISLPNRASDDWIEFPKFGKFHPNGKVLQLLYFANESGACFSAFRGDEKPCPQEGFPLP